MKDFMLRMRWLITGRSPACPGCSPLHKDANGDQIEYGVAYVDRKRVIRYKTNEEEMPDIQKGVGDSVAKMTKAVGIKPCGKCKERQEKLNRMFPYASNNKFDPETAVNDTGKTEFQQQ